MIPLHKQLDKLLENIEGKTLLLHTCCAPCSSYVLEYLGQHLKITLFYYNPNITDKTEYQKRRNEHEKLTRIVKSKFPIAFLEGEYEPSDFFRVAKGLEAEQEGGARCFQCYELRLKMAAQKAKELGSDYFTTTLSVSPHKNSQKLDEIALMCQHLYGVDRLPSDFKKKDGYKKSVQRSKEIGLYRQDYCGCPYSLPKE